MTGTRESLGAMIGDLAGTAAVRRRILQTLFPLLLTMPWRSNFKQMARWSGCNEGTIHNWFGANLELVDFQRSLIDKFSSGSYCVFFDPSYVPKSGKSDLDEECLPLIYQDQEKKVRTGKVWVKCLKRIVRLVSVEYLRADDSVQSHKLYFCTDTEKDWTWILQAYALRFQIEFIFRDAKQFAGLTHCQSTNKTKLENHFNLALGAVSVAKTAHWLPIDKEQRGPFSMAELKTYYHNLALVERFSIALNLNPTEIKNNPKIKELLFSSSYVDLAA